MAAYSGCSNADDAKFEEYLEESSYLQDDRTKLNQSECYLQEVYALRRKLASSDALRKECQHVNEALEKSFNEYKIKTEKLFAEKEEKYKTTKREYESHIANLEINITQNAEKIIELHKELQKYEHHETERLHYTSFIDDDTVSTFDIPNDRKFDELIALIQNDKEKQEQLEQKLANVQSQHQEVQNILKITKQQLTEKDEVLRNTREELAMNRIELETLKIIPASDTCKGNSLFAEVEDRRQILLEKMKMLQEKYSEAKRVIHAKTGEIKIMKAEKNAMIRKWELDAIDTLQENTDLLDKYKSKIFELENKLKIEMKRNNQEAMDICSTDISFNYAQSLLATKKKELQQLNEKFEKLSIEMLVQEETNHSISKQLRYWRSKAMLMETQILTIKTQLEIEQISDNTNKTLLEAIENCTVTDNSDFTKVSESRVTPANLLFEDLSQDESAEISIKSVTNQSMNKHKEFQGKFLRFSSNTKDIEKKPMKKTSKMQSYPIISIPDDI